MAKIMNLSIADQVHADIDDLMNKQNKSNRSEFVEELIRIGLSEQKKEVGTNGK